jgi:hypothetical protein
MFKHEGGNLQTWNADGTKDTVIYYGPGLHKDCVDCNMPKGVQCVTKSGKSLNKSHSARMR